MSESTEFWCRIIALALGVLIFLHAVLHPQSTDTDDKEGDE